jgi:hypothetical protein
MFGALAASPNGAVKGFGVPVSQLSFGLLVFPGVWDWYLQWREQRRGFYTKWEEDMLMVAQALSRADVGWIRQHPELLRNVRRIAGLIEQEESDRGQPVRLIPVRRGKLRIQAGFHVGHREEFSVAAILEWASGCC